MSILTLGVAFSCMSSLSGTDFSVVKGNYYPERLNLIQDKDYALEMNKAIKHRISEIKHTMDIEFLTPLLYE